jgi:hypothetical protein
MCPVQHARDLVADTSGLWNSSPSPKSYLISPLEEKKRRCRYVIYKWIDTNSYYRYKNDDDNILEKFKQHAEEEMRGRALRKW